MVKLLELLGLSFSALKERKVRSGLTVLMVVIGVTLMTSLNGLGGGMDNYINEQLGMLAPNVLIITPSEVSMGFGPPQESPEMKLTSQTVKTIEKTRGVKEVFPIMFYIATIKSGGEEKTIQIMGLEQNNVKYIAPKVSLKSGSYVLPSDNIGMVVGHSLAYPSGSSKPIARQDQTVTIEFQKVESKGGMDKIVVKKKSFQVKGILEELGGQEIDNVAFISLPAANALFEKGGYYDAIYAITIDPEENDAVEERIRKIYGKNIGLTSPKALAETIGEVMGAWNVFISTIASVSIFVGAVGIVTTLYASVMDRTREIGLLKAIGYGNKSILFMFLTEAMAIGILGGLCGLLLGVGGAYALIQIMLRIDPYASGEEFITPYFSPTDIAGIFLLAFILSIIAGLYPAWRASRLNPIEALRKE